jgi:hypothetical protein
VRIIHYSEYLSSLTLLRRFEMVWRETLTTYREMISEEGWTDKKEISLPAVQSVTFKVRWLSDTASMSILTVKRPSNSAGASDHRTMWIRVFIHLVGTAEGSRWADVHSRDVTRRCRHLYDLDVCPQMDPEPTVQKVCTIPSRLS